jgi:Tfp pilus assembly protein PilF
MVRGTLAGVFAERSDHEAARREYEQVLRLQRLNENDSSMINLDLAGNLAVEEMQTGHVDSAATMLRTLVAISVARYGDSHETTAEARVRLGEVLDAKHAFAEAIPVTNAGIRAELADSVSTPPKER